MEASCRLPDASRAGCASAAAGGGLLGAARVAGSVAASSAPARSGSLRQCWSQCACAIDAGAMRAARPKSPALAPQQAAAHWGAALGQPVHWSVLQPRTRLQEWALEWLPGPCLPHSACILGSHVWATRTTHTGHHRSGGHSSAGNVPVAAGPASNGEAASLPAAAEAAGWLFQESACLPRAACVQHPSGIVPSGCDAVLLDSTPAAAKRPAC